MAIQEGPTSGRRLRAGRRATDSSVRYRPFSNGGVLAWPGLDVNVFMKFERSFICFDLFLLKRFNLNVVLLWLLPFVIFCFPSWLVLCGYV
jgi:hypothetical protein